MFVQGQQFQGISSVDYTDVNAQLGIILSNTKQRKAKSISTEDELKKCILSWTSGHQIT